MNIQIDTVRIAGFRGIANLEILLPRIAVLVGANNSGKTSLLKAMQLALGDYARYLSEEDFYIAIDETRTDEIIVDTRIVSLDDEGNRNKVFNDEWATEFGDKIKAEADGSQFVALRTRVKTNAIKDGYDVSRSILEKWPDIKQWSTEKIKETKIRSRINSLSFISIDAQRDIHQDLKEKSSFIGKVLSGIQYNPADIAVLEGHIKEINDEALAKSNELQSLKGHLDQLNQSFNGAGNAEITPFPKKIRDLSKNFSVHLGNSTENAFSMEYHGMGTRSWASMLTVKAFTDLMVEKYAYESEAFFPILAAEEPEAHLHPSAQKTLYRQLAESKGQVLVSTHSPYLAAMAEQSDLRYLKRTEDGTEIRFLDPTLADEEKRRLQREVIHSRGEILFSKALVLCEGETEEQALPQLFKKYFDEEPFVLGVNFVGVGGSGKKYLPFLTFANDFGIPVFIFSDGEEKTIKDLAKNYKKVFGEIDISNCSNITILEDEDFEGYLLSSGFEYIIKNTIEELDGADAVNAWIIKRDGTLAGRKKTDLLPCENCTQPIYEDVIRDYKADGGHKKAMIDILDSSKPKYAPMIAEKLCELKNVDFPPKIIEFLEKIKAGAEL